MVPTEEARITIQIFEVEIWSDDVIGALMGTLAISALLKRSRAARPDSC